MPAKTSEQPYAVQRLHTVAEAQIRGLADLLIDCVDGGASVIFMHPLPADKALDFWRRVAAARRPVRHNLFVPDPG